MIKPMAIVIAVIVAPAALFVAFGGLDGPSDRGSAALIIPNLSFKAHEGREHFAAACGACHGAYGEGSDNGPVLIHALYGRTLFLDEQIVAAVREGAEARNWPFGDMPAVEGVSDQNLDMMIGFLREVQAANDIQ